MHRTRLVVIVVLTVFVASAGWAAREVEDFSQTINDFKKSSDVAPFFDTAHGFAAFPNIGKAGLGIGGSGGSHATAGYHKGMLVFVIGKGGLMYEAAIGGQKYSFKPVN